MDSNDYAVELTKKYAGELHELEKCWDKHEGFVGYGFFESYIAYCIVREFKPTRIFEIAPACGFSTYPMALALKRNGRGKVFSFERNEEYLKIYRNNMKKNGLTEFTEPILGDARIEVKRYLSEPVDVLFMDGDHSDTFAKWYLNNLLPKTRMWMQVHDINYLRESGETKTVLQFLEENKDYKWFASWVVAERSPVKFEERRGEANSSIWVKMPELK